ncbi:MAG: 2-phosphosulfolactate phosphatase [Candidatus Kapabacteria bacterium]|nr:2-phosphosulfolactate phosphatase [Candidatus Kapabacteria bacterium]
MPLEINVALTPRLLTSAEALTTSIVLVIDVFRATTTIAQALENGAKEIFPVGTLAEAESKARELRGRLGEKMVMLCGERGGTKPEGFDIGNSPLEYTPERIEGKTLVFSTTNGTQAIQTVQSAPLVLAASFANLRAVVNFVVKYLVLNEARAKERSGGALAEISEISTINTIYCVCAGGNGDFSYEDTLCAGAIAEALVRELTEGDYDITCSDATTAARNLHRAEPNPSQALAQSHHARYLADIGFAEDVVFSAKPNTSRMIPLLRSDGAFIHWHNPLNL